METFKDWCDDFTKKFELDGIQVIESGYIGQFEMKIENFVNENKEVNSTNDLYSICDNFNIQTKPFYETQKPLKYIGYFRKERGCTVECIKNENGKSIGFYFYVEDIEGKAEYEKNLMLGMLDLKSKKKVKRRM